MRLYFAYGSNMNPRQFQRRCPGSRVLGRAILRNHRFIITRRGYASVVPTPGTDVHGVLQELTPEDESTLDRYEGIEERIYRREELEVIPEAGPPVLALIYIDLELAEGHPRPGYLEGVLEGALHHGLPPTTIQAIEAWRHSPSPRDR